MSLQEGDPHAGWDLFLSCDDADAAAAATLHQELTRRELRVFWADVSLQPGDDVRWLSQRAQLGARITVVLHSRRTQPAYVRREEIARALNEAQVPLRDQTQAETHRVVPVWLDGEPAIDDPDWGLLQKVGLDVGELPGGLADAAAALEQLVRRLGPGGMAQARTDRPFRPLEPFLPQDRDLFFGRDVKVRDLCALVEATPLCVLHGSSGTGKTSLLQAGLRPLLDRAAFQRWLAARTPWVVGGNDLVPKSLPSITEDFTGPPPPAPKLDPACVALCEQAAKDNDFANGHTLKDCLANCR